jgi:hypothetical protein
MKIEHDQIVEFILDFNPAHKGKGRVVCTHSHAFEVELLHNLKEYSKGSIIIVDRREIVE